MSLLGVKHERLLGKPLNFLLSETQIFDLKVALNKQSNIPQIQHFTIEVQGENQYFYGLVYPSEQLIVLEFEPTNAAVKPDVISFQGLLEDTLMEMQRVTYLQDLLSLFTARVRELTGFERVMVYRFTQDGTGIVDAESRVDDVISYLGLHFPSIDIPESARELFQLNALRLIPDIEQETVPLMTLGDEVASDRLDLSHSMLRQPSPCHLQYLRNMDVTASMVMPLVKDEKIWGLITGHHRSPKHLSQDVRTACVFLGKVMGLELNNKVSAEELQTQKQQQRDLSDFIEAIAEADDLRVALTEPDEKLLSLVNAGGVAICLDSEIICLGETPDVEEIRALMSWATPQVKDNIFYTDALAKNYPPAEQLQAVASGILLLQISKVRQYSILWLRPEVAQKVQWAGNPAAQLDEKDDGSLELSPRRSFEIWQEIVHHRSESWRDSDIKIALELRSSLVSIVLNKADELANLNVELRRSNRELDSFAYAASHDLQEPLRGIYNYANLMLRDYPETLEEEGIQRLSTIMRLTQRMQSLVESLLHFSRLGQAELRRQSTDLNQLVHDEIRLLQLNNKQTSIEFLVGRSLPTVEVDPILLKEVFSNLLTNALKYNTRTDKVVEIGYLTPQDDDFAAVAKEYKITDQFIYFVKDNGIGIRDRHLEKVFKLFKRLHGRDKFGGGTGAGLTITQKAVEHHGGLIWVTSEHKKGSTFYFTLNTPCTS